MHAKLFYQNAFHEYKFNWNTCVITTRRSNAMWASRIGDRQGQGKGTQLSGARANTKIGPRLYKRVTSEPKHSSILCSGPCFYQSQSGWVKSDSPTDLKEWVGNLAWVDASFIKDETTFRRSPVSMLRAESIQKGCISAINEKEHVSIQTMKRI